MRHKMKEKIEMKDSDSLYSLSTEQISNYKNEGIIHLALPEALKDKINNFRIGL